MASLAIGAHKLDSPGTYMLPWLTDGGISYMDSSVSIIKPSIIPRRAITAGFFGAAYGEYLPKDIGLFRDTCERVIILGREIAKRNIIALTGAAPGIPNQAAYGASLEKGMVLGVAPIGNETLHSQEIVKTVGRLASLDESLVNQWDIESRLLYSVIIYLNIGHRTMERSFVQRDTLPVYCSRIAFFADGDAGTLHEAAVARELGHRVLAVLSNSGGVSNSLPRILNDDVKKDNKTVVVADEDPYRLVEKAVDRAHELHEERIGIDDTLDVLLDQVFLAMVGKPFIGRSQEDLIRHKELAFTGLRFSGN